MGPGTYKTLFSRPSCNRRKGKNFAVFLGTGHCPGRTGGAGLATWVDADERTLLGPLGTIHGVWQCREEDVHAADPEGSEEGVVDTVESSDLKP